MASTITALSTGAGGLSQSGDLTGALALRTNNGTTALTLDTSQNATFAGTINSGNITSTGTVSGATGTLYPLVASTAVNTTSGTSIDFIGIPSWVKRITILFSAVSTSGTSPLLIQIGNGAVETTGYAGVGIGATGANTTSSVTTTGAGFPIDANNQAAAATSRNGTVTIALVTGTNYSYSSVVSGNAYCTMVGATKTTSAIIDRVRITSTIGTDTFDAGQINILYE